MRTNDVLATLDLLKLGLGVGRQAEKVLQQMKLKHTIPSVPV